MKKKPGPKKKSYEERKHSITTYHTGEAIKAFGTVTKLKRWIEKVTKDKINELKKTQDESK